MTDRSLEDPIVHNLLKRFKRNTKSISSETDEVRDDDQENHLIEGSAASIISDASEYQFYDGAFDYDYLDALINGDGKVSQDNSEQDSVRPNIVYRDFPVEEGYVRIPVEFPGLTLTKITAPSPKLWTAEDAFKDQVLARICALEYCQKEFNSTLNISGNSYTIHVHTVSAAWFHHRYGDLDNPPDSHPDVYHVEEDDRSKDTIC